MVIQILLISAAVAVYCESPPRLIKPVFPEPRIAVQPIPEQPKVVPIDRNPPIRPTGALFIDDPKKTIFDLLMMWSTTFVNEQVKQDKNAVWALVPFKLLNVTTQIVNGKLHTMDAEMSESECKVQSPPFDPYEKEIPAYYRCAVKKGGKHPIYRIKVNIRVDPATGSDTFYLIDAKKIGERKPKSNPK